MSADELTRSVEAWGRTWRAVQSELTPWLACRVRPPLEPEDIASEVVRRGLRCPDLTTLAWPQLWTWAVKTALHHAFDLLRGHQRRPCSLLAEPDRLPQRGLAEGDAPHALQLVNALRLRAAGTRLQVLEMLAAEEVCNAEMAVRLGISKRAIEQARQWLRGEAAKLRDDARSPRSCPLAEARSRSGRHRHRAGSGASDG